MFDFLSMIGENPGIAGVALVPLIIGLIEAIKRFFKNAPGEVWFALSLVFGVAGEVVLHIIAHGLPFDLAGWTELVVLGIAFGLASGKAYDEYQKKNS